MEKSRKRLTLNERIVIETLLKENKSKSYIAKHNWVIKPTDIYKASIADFFAKDDYLNKRNKDKINTYKKLKHFVYKGLLSGFSPEQIAGRIKLLYPNDIIMSISYEAIYQHIYKHRQSYLGKKLIKLLPYHHHKRRQNRKFGIKKTRIKDQVNISQRPENVKLRLEIGHWEGDLNRGKKNKIHIYSQNRKQKIENRYTTIC